MSAEQDAFYRGAMVGVVVGGILYVGFIVFMLFASGRCHI